MIGDRRKPKYPESFDSFCLPLSQFPLSTVLTCHFLNTSTAESISKSPVYNPPSCTGLPQEFDTRAACLSHN